MTPAERETLILSLEPRVNYHAKRLRRSLPLSVALEDLVSAGWCGAIDAVDRYDADRKIQLEFYADHRIRGAIIDYLRSLDHISRDHRRAVNRGECDAPINISTSPRFSDQHGRSIFRPGPLAVVACPRDRAERKRLDARLLLESLYTRARLRPRNAQVLKLSMEGEEGKPLGRSFGIHESRVSQICKDAIIKLRAAA